MLERARPGEKRFPLTVSALVSSADVLLQEQIGWVWVEGEVSSLRAPGSGHVYFVLKDDSGESQVALPDGQFYLSIAPYVSRTHECFYHSLTTCTGELADQAVDVTIVDSTGKTLVDGPAQTYANGFVGFWLPRDIEGTITVTHQGRTATSAISTDREAPTCLTTLQLT